MYKTCYIALYNWTDWFGQCFPSVKCENFSSFAIDFDDVVVVGYDRQFKEL